MPDQLATVPSGIPVAPGPPRPRPTHAAPTNGTSWLPWVVGRGRYALALGPVADIWRRRHSPPLAFGEDAEPSL